VAPEQGTERGIWRPNRGTGTCDNDSRQWLYIIAIVHRLACVRAFPNAACCMPQRGDSACTQISERVCCSPSLFHFHSNTISVYLCLSLSVVMSFVCVGAIMLILHDSCPGHPFASLALNFHTKWGLSQLSPEH